MGKLTFPKMKTKSTGESHNIPGKPAAYASNEDTVEDDIRTPQALTNPNLKEIRRRAKEPLASKPYVENVVHIV